MHDQNWQSRYEALREAAADFLDQDHRSQHVIEGWWGAEEHAAARKRLEGILNVTSGPPARAERPQIPSM